MEIEKLIRIFENLKLPPYLFFKDYFVSGCTVMSEDCLLEEDIWEYKSIRKLNSVSHDLESVSKNVQKSNDGKEMSQRCVNRKVSKERETSRKTKQGPRKRGSQPLLKPEQHCNASNDDPIAHSQESVLAASGKPKKNFKKQKPSKPRPVYEGYCPNCQMPFSLLLIETPQWHVSECLDGSGLAEKECPDGLTCTSSIPSHYKRFSHLLLAACRAGEYVPELSSNSTENHSFMSGTIPSIQCNDFDYGALLDLNDSQNVGKPPEQCLMLPQQGSMPTNTINVTNKTTSSLYNIEEPEHQMQCTDNTNFIGCLGSLSEEYDKDLKSQHVSYQVNALTSDAESNDGDISYSPLNTDGEEGIPSEEEEAEEKKHYRNKQFDLRGMEDKNEGAESSVFNVSQLKAFNHNSVERIQACTRNNESFQILNTLQCKGRTSEPLSQDDIVNRVYSSTNVAEVLKCPTKDHTVPVECKRTKEQFEMHNLSYTFKTGEFGWSSFNDCNWAAEDSAVRNTSLSSQFKDGVTPSVFGQKEASAHSCLDKTVTGTGRNRLGSNNSCSLAGKEERFCNSMATPFPPSPVSKILPYVSAANTQVKHSPAKELKQMDIGVFFGLQPKAKMEDDKKKTLSENMQTLGPSAVTRTKPRSQKRKAKGSLGDSDGIAESSSKNVIPTDPASGGQRRWRKRFRESCPDEDETRKRQCPFYKKIPGTCFVVDAFQYGEIEGCKGYFLTHFHSDHYGGLTKTFTSPIYCNKITGNLVKSKLRVPEKYIHILPMNGECIIDGIKVVLLDANHCPGAAMILFAFPNGTVILHTGDFRADPSMERYPFLIGQKISTLYLDTTYCRPEYTFPSQQEVIQFAVNTAFETVTLHPRTLVVCGTYSIGKEKIFLAIADVLGSKVSMSQDKYKTLQCLESTAINSLITLDWNNTLLHLLPMMQINFKNLQNHLNKFSEKFDQILAFKPTGWTYSDRCCSLSDIQPQTRGKITIYGIPYSEHSSFLEMKRFVQWLKPQKIIPTVNVGNWKARKEMENHFRDWKMDVGGWN